MTQVSQTQPSYITRISPAEARILLGEYQAMKSDVPVTQGMITQAVQELTTLLDDFGQGRAIYQARFPQNPITENSDHSEPLNPLAQINELKNPTYAEKLKRPEIFAKDLIELSQANYDDLKKNQPMGSIEPKCPDKFFPNKELLTPLPNGYTRNLGLAEYYPNEALKGFVAPQQKNQQIAISCPKQGFCLPVPNNSQLASIEDSQAKLAKPSPTNPIIWRINTQQDTLKYTIQEHSSEEAAILDTQANPDLIPTPEEQEYWRQVLPLPAILKQKIQESPKDFLRLLVSYLGIKNKETGLTNFTYSANSLINNFMKEHKADLPLIVSELKTGHCDTLSWYLAALLRSQGKPAWVSRGLVTTENGKAFQGAYGHSVVMTVDDKNQIIQIDPTQYTEHDPAYLHEEFPVDAFYKMQTKFSKAKTNKAKAKYLQEFNQVLQKTREEIAADPVRKKRVQNSMTAMMGHFNMLAEFESSSGLELQKALKKQVVNFNAELEKNQEFSIERVFELLPKSFYGAHQAWIPRLCSLGLRRDEEFDKVSTKSERENLSKAFRLCKNAEALLYRTFAFDDDDMDVLNRILFPRTEKLEDKLIDLPNPLEDFFEDRYHRFSDQIPIAIVLDALLDARVVQSGLDHDFSKINVTSTEALTHSYGSLFSRELKNNSLYSDCVDSEPIEKINLILGHVEDIRGEGVGDLALPEVKQYMKDFNYFIASFQKACHDARFRKEFLVKINKDEAWFRKLTEVLIYKARAKVSQTRTDAGVYKKYDKKFFYPLYLDTDDKNRLSRLYKAALKQLDTQFHAGQVTEDNDLRLYIYGDSARDVNWKATARSEKIYVNKQPRTEAGINTPLHVLVNVEDTTLARLKLLELVSTLQKDVKRTNREIFIGFRQAGCYVKLSPRIDPRIIVQSLMDNDSKNQVSHLNSQGKPVNNLVYVSNDYNAISGMEYLYQGLARHNISSIYLRDPKYDVYPLIDKAWVEESNG